MRPKCKDLKNKVIRLHKTCKTLGGETYYEGELLVCLNMNKEGIMELRRVGNGLRIEYEQAVKIVGDRKEIFGA